MNDYAAILKDRLPAAGAFQACFAFSIHKAGSTLMNNMIRAACAAENVPAISIPDTLFTEGVLDSDWRQDSALSPYFGDGRVYFGFRFFPEVLAERMSWIRERKSVLLVRDPRDALVSEYFSYGGKSSHAVPTKNRERFVEQFSKSSGIEIDDYVKRAAPGYRRKLQGYLDCLDFGSTKLFRYEEIYFEKAAFLRDIFVHFDLPVSEDAIQTVSTRFDIRPAQEDQTKHIRKAVPGDHTQKLKRETISFLNAFFADTCSSFGYDFR